MTRRLLSLAGLALFAAACGETKPPPPAPRPAAGKPAAVVVPEETKETPAEAMYVYTPTGKRDPFLNVFAVKEVTKVVQPGRKPTPLQKWSIDQLRLAMTMTGTSSPFAMIEDPDGRGHAVRVGDFVGQNWGKVTGIKRDSLIITESITDHATGRVFPNNITLKIPKSEAEMRADELLREGQTTADLLGKQQ
jgi:type IV pilus assembly protein PilP